MVVFERGLWALPDTPYLRLILRQIDAAMYNFTTGETLSLLAKFADGRRP